MVIAAYEAAATIDAALASVATQTLAPSEVVVVVDGSRDGTAEVAGRWASLLPLRVVDLKENGGPARARHIGIQESTATLIALLDSDDVMLPDHLGSLVAEHRGVDDIVTPQLLRWLPGVGLATDWRNSDTPERSPGLALLQRNFLALHSLFSRSLYERAGGFRDGMTGAEDWDLWIRMVRLGGRVVRSNHPTVMYRLSQGSLSADGRNLTSEIAVLERAREEATTPRERAVAARALRCRRAALRLSASYAHARHGRSWSARWAALRSLSGSRATVARALALVLAPGLTVTARDRRKWDGERWLRA